MKGGVVPAISGTSTGSHSHGRTVFDRLANAGASAPVTGTLKPGAVSLSGLRNSRPSPGTDSETLATFGGCLRASLLRQCACAVRTRRRGISRIDPGDPGFSAQIAPNIFASPFGDLVLRTFAWARPSRACGAGTSGPAGGRRTRRPLQAFRAWARQPDPVAAGERFPGFPAAIAPSTPRSPRTGHGVNAVTGSVASPPDTPVPSGPDREFPAPASADRRP